MTFCAVIMAGGSGTRLWPLSRASHPKQFLSLDSDDTMIQATVKRLTDLNVESIVIICNEEHRFLVAEQLRQVNQLGSIILEPVGRNTAPAVALAAMLEKNDPLLLVLSADHVIQDDVSFCNAVTSAIPQVQSGKLVTFGIVADEPNVGYGYIKKGQPEGEGFLVDEFVEKPSIELAESYVSSGEYYWNSGMFMFKGAKYLDELKKYRPDIFKICETSCASAEMDMDFVRVDKEVFETCPSESVDYAVMEKTSDAVVVPMDAGWSDVGSWSSLWDVSSKDSSGNSVHGDVVLHNSSNSYIRTDNKLVAALGVDDLVIVSTKDVVMVAQKDSVQDVKIVVQQLQDKARPECSIHREVYRPWGKYDSIDSGPRYQVKRISVNPGQKLSVQMHHHRAEHWVVVSGTAKVTKGDEIIMLSENESVYLPLGIIHALENPGKVVLELIEVQSGSYLGEDDIVRFEDNYGRS